MEVMEVATIRNLRKIFFFNFYFILYIYIYIYISISHIRRNSAQCTKIKISQAGTVPTKIRRLRKFQLLHLQK